MASPKSVREKAQQVDAMIKAQAAAARGEEPEAEVTEPEVVEEPAEEQDDEPQAPPEDDQGGEQDPATSDDELERVRAEAAQWEQRYRSLDGMIKSRDRQIDQLYDMLSQFQKAAEAPTQPQTEQPPTPVGATEKDIDTFGADLVDLVRRVAGEVANSVLSDASQRIEKLESSVGDTRKVVAQTQEQRFADDLTRAVPNWREIDDDPAFLEWIKASRARTAVFSEAAKALDAAALADFYRDWNAMQAAKKQTPQAPTRKQQLERQVAPGQRRAAPTPQAVSDADEGQKIWTRAEIANVYANRKRMKPEEFAKLEREIADAQRDGRVDYS